MIAGVCQWMRTVMKIRISSDVHWPSVISSTSPLSPKHLDLDFSQWPNSESQASLLASSSMLVCEKGRRKKEHYIGGASELKEQRAGTTPAFCDHASHINTWWMKKHLLCKLPRRRARLFGHHFPRTSSVAAEPFRGCLKHNSSCGDLSQIFLIAWPNVSQLPL